jgi:hypothetical protein
VVTVNYRSCPYDRLLQNSTLMNVGIKTKHFGIFGLVCQYIYEVFNDYIRPFKNCIFERSQFPPFNINYSLISFSNMSAQKKT